MNFKITQPKNRELKKVIEYFLFIQSTNEGLIHNYTTYPNNNCCLALYKSNRIIWNKAENSCAISNDPSGMISSKLYGWHNKPFKVSITGSLDQVCILFNITGLSQFTPKALHQISLEDDPFSQIFGFDKNYFKKQLFATDCIQKRTELLQDFLVQQIKPRPIALMQSYIDHVGGSIMNNGHKSKNFCKENNISESTLFRASLEMIGESPKDIMTKYRFRMFLNHLNTNSKLTDIAYLLNYSDQSHLIKEVNKFTGLSPRKFASSIKKEENNLVVTY